MCICYTYANYESIKVLWSLKQNSKKKLTKFTTFKNTLLIEETIN